MAQIGKEESAPFDAIRTIVNRVLGSARSLARLWPRDRFPSEEAQQKHFDLIDKYEAVFWDMDDEDTINPELDRIILDMENTCRSIADGKSAFMRVLTYVLS